MKSSFSRYIGIAALLSLMSALIVFQIIRIQIKFKDVGAEMRKRYSESTVSIRPERGSIYDRDGHLLAGNQEVYEVGVRLDLVKSPELVAREVTTILGSEYSVSYSVALDLVKTPYVPNTKEYVTLARDVPVEKLQLLEKAYDDYHNRAVAAGRLDDPTLLGVVWKPYLRRSYPENSLASNILGFFQFRHVPEQATAAFGIEEQYDYLLSGTPREYTYPVDPTEIEDLPNIPPGASLILSIDREIQAMTEDVLDRSLAANGATSGSIIVSDPRTGEILAMATTPRLNPNEYWKYSEIFPGTTPFNRIVSQTYEPGSVFKVLVMAAALDAGVVTPDTPFYDSGSIEVGGVVIHNWDYRGWGPQTMLTCMQHSLNVCLSWVATQLGEERMYSYLEAFGINRRTNIDLAGESTWPMTTPKDDGWYTVNLATNSFGQGISVTPIQMVTAVSAVANDGKMMVPHILKGVVNNGKQYNSTPQVVGAPIKAETAHTLSDMLAISLEEEASNALVPGYRVSGKTGTASIPTKEGYVLSSTNASFVGWGPTDDPRFLIYVWFEKPTSDIWGSTVAAPVFSEVARNLVVLMKLPPDQIRLQLKGQ